MSQRLTPHRITSLHNATQMNFSIIIIASGVFVMDGDAVIAVIPGRAPSPSGLCAQEATLAAHAKTLALDALMAGKDVAETLHSAGLLVEYAGHDWCAPRYQLRGRDSWTRDLIDNVRRVGPAWFHGRRP